MDLLIPLALAALLIFFLFNSRRKQKARAEEIKTGLVPGATVMTTFGVFGTVLSIDDENNQVTLESGPGTVLRVHRQAIGQISNPEAGGAAADGAVAGSAGAADDAQSTEAPAITDAELDAMNERKRAEGSTDDSELAADDIDAELNANDEQVDADDAEAASSDKTAGSPPDDEVADDSGDTDAGASDADSSDPDNNKKN
ncbi:MULTISPECIES: preprotein translocase subunit YajC [Brevibacterium]|uniref:Preprotein translocase subunit n=2 Tax=Brevibacterium TaxID=1696 RepID=A0A1H1XNU2_BRESA|nr:preprotein translocase subunit YajC [Brevibacterium sandarakinum]SDT10843.1 Preprotein translocase subunit [Brevibacterium sandarakinum]